MQGFLLIESRAGFDRSDPGFCIELARSLAGSGTPVSVLLVQNGVLAARASARAEGLAELIAAGVPVLADDFSLAERGIAADRLADGIAVTPLDVVIDRMSDGWNVLWH